MNIDKSNGFSDVIQVGNVLTVTPEPSSSVLVCVEYADGSKVKTSVSSATTFGPYLVDMRMSAILASGSGASVVESVSQRSDLTNMVTTTTNPLTGVIKFIDQIGKVLTQTESDAWRNAPQARSDKQFGSRTRQCTKGGKLLYAFSDHSVLVKSGANAAGVTLSTVSGYNGIAADSSGSRTGSPSMVKIVGDGTASGNILISVPTAQITQAVIDGKMGLWVYCDYGNAAVPTINGLWSTAATLLNEHSNSWNTNQFRHGWNFLVYDAKQSTHPFGVSVSYGGANDITTTAVRNFALQFSTLANCTIYLDSVWYDFDQKPKIVLGWDSADQDVIDYVLPAMQARGWRGYIAEPCFVWSSGSTRYDNMSEAGARVSRMNTFAAAGWDIANHTTTHRAIGSLTNDFDIRYEVENWKAWALANGWTKGYEFYVSPQSSTSPLAERVIRESGVSLQRHAKKRNIHRTPWGIDNPHHLGSFEMGNVTFASIKSAIDANIGYRADTFLFGHNTVAGGAADGSTIPGVGTQTYLTTLILVLDYIKSLESAGLVDVADGLSGYYYS